MCVQIVQLYLIWLKGYINGGLLGFEYDINITNRSTFSHKLFHGIVGQYGPAISYRSISMRTLAADLFDLQAPAHVHGGVVV